MNTAIIRLCLLLLLGIILGFYLELPLKMAFSGLLLGLLIFLAAYFRTKRLFLPDVFFGSSTFLLFLLLGILVGSLNLPQNQPRHYLNKVSPEEISLLKLRIKESLKPDLYNHKFNAEVLAVDNQLSHGKILLLQPKDTAQSPFLEGEELVAAVIPEEVPTPLNPHQFDYAKFMNRKGVSRQAALKTDQFKKLPNEDSDLRTEAAHLRKNITSALQQRNFGAEELAIVQALLLGQKQDISAETYNNFAAAGAIHILAVSGLHVGIMLLLLNRLFSPLARLKKGKFLKTFLVILCLWGFAVLAGLSPSVVRAVTMFSFVAVGMEIKRRTGTLNSVFLSLLLLLLIKPQWVFEVGFQLSYAAVISIVLLRPILLDLWNPENKIAKYIWDLLTVTFAAQLGVLPLSLYYFHQFPGLFFLSNLLILPFLGVILILGVLVMFFALAGILPRIVAQVYETLISGLNKVVELVAQQEEFIFRDIPFSTTEVLAWYLLIFLLYLLLKSPTYQKLLLTLISIVLLQGSYLYQKANQAEHFVVFHGSRKTLLGKAEDNHLSLYTSKITSELPGFLRNYLVGERISEIAQKPLQNIYRQKGHFLILLDSTGIYPKQVPQNSFLILSHSPRINLERVLEQVRPSAIIADGSNYKSAVTRWRETADEKNIPFHYTAEDGAFSLEQKESKSGSNLLPQIRF